jgi:iron-sulfur cluster assembly protein
MRTGVRMFVDMFSAQLSQWRRRFDYVTGVMGSGFTFKNPNATGAVAVALRSLRN